MQPSGIGGTGSAEIDKQRMTTQRSLSKGLCQEHMLMLCVAKTGRRMQAVAEGNPESAGAYHFAPQISYEVLVAR